MAAQRNIFASFIQAGFECSTHRYENRRLDLLACTKHDDYALEDFSRVGRFGIKTVRTGTRWHLIERCAGVYNFESLDPILYAAENSGTELILDLFHFGWPDHLDILDPAFSAHFGNFVRAVVRHLRQHRIQVCVAFSVVNEISFLSWVAGDIGGVFPHLVGEGGRMKAILVRAAVVGSEILLNELSRVRLTAPEPVIHIVGDPAIEGDELEAERFRVAQFETWDMLSGRMCPELGGRPEYLDIVGLNYYDRNQWVHHQEPLRRTDARYRPFRQIITEVWRRYQRPLFISETGTEDEDRPGWLRYVCDEVEAAEHEGVPVEGICLYPILNHPGWEDDRHCHNGLFDYPDENGHREVFQPLADEILWQQEKRKHRAKSLHDLQPA